MTELRETVPLLAIAALVATFAASGIVPHEHFDEGRAVETVSMLAYALASLLAAALACTVVGPTRFDAALGAVLLAALAAREADLHKTELLGSLTRTATYVDPTRPLALRALAALILLGVIVAALALAWRRLDRGGRRGLAPLRSNAVVFGPILLLAVAKLIDGAERKLADAGIAVGPAVGSAFVRVEESLEALAALALCAAVFALVRTRLASLRPARAERTYA